ncbi:MAG: diguanylate cyclase [Deltaproteobacteria bacterium]|nr:diguanylate cyclase [Deltaproteobacteria bacterium]
MYYPILLVNSSESFCSEISDALNRSGYFVISATTAKDSLEAIDAGVYGVAILPATFETRSGFELLARVRGIWADTKVLMLDDGSLGRENYEFISSTKKIDYICAPNYKSDDVALIAARLAGIAPPMTRIPGAVHSMAAGSPFSMPRRAGTSLPVPPAPRQHSMEVGTEEDTLQLEIMRLAREYQKTLPTELRHLRNLITTAQQSFDAEDAIWEIRSITHTISGTSGTLGFMEISEIVHQINDKIKKIQSRGNGTNEEWENLFYLVDRAISTPERSSLVPVGPAAAQDLATLLVLGEDRASLMILQDIGRLNQVRVIPASTRVEALAEIIANDIDGVIIDQDMRNLDPVSLVADLRAMEGHESLQVAFMSNVDSVDRRIAAASAGAMLFLGKPLTDDILVEVAREFATQQSQITARILIVDDDPFFRKHISNILASEHLEVQELDQPQRILETLDVSNPDILLLDVQMPEISGFDVSRMIRSVPRWRNLPVLFLTGESDVKVRIECFNVGGDDYIQKPVIKEELLARINVRLERIRLFKERADRDPLTRLLNRRAFLEEVQAKMTEAAHFDRPVSLCIIDLDHFKHVNDTFGHLAGDRVLKAMGKLLLSRFRNTDVRCRWGGEEFAVVFYNEGGANAKRLLYEALKALRKLEFTGDGGESFQVTFSSGVATFPRDAATFDQLFKVADECLYRAKENGRNQIQTAGSGQGDTVLPGNVL